MKKWMIGLCLMMFFSISFAQDGKVKNKYYKDGSPFTIFEQVSHDIIGIKVYHENGKLAKSGYYKNNVLHGIWKDYSKKGTLISESHYNNNQKIGNWKVWDGLGNLVYEEQFNADWLSPDRQVKNKEK